MADYFDFHARSSLDEYVELCLLAKDEGLPVKMGLEVDYVRGSMEQLSALYHEYPFDVLIGSVHWLGTWQFDDLDSEVAMAQWRTRRVEECWDEYTNALEELAAAKCVDVLAHPDLIKVAGRVPSHPREFWERMTEAATRADVSLECSSAGWTKPGGEQYPAEGFLDLAVDAGLTFTTASDAHRHQGVGARVDDLVTLLSARGVNELASYSARERVLVRVPGH